MIQVNIKKVAISGFVAAMVMVSLNAEAYKGSEYTKDAKITLEEARSIALKTFPGTVVEEELEHKKGGSGLRFSFDIRSASHVTHELGIDSQTGAVLENSKESEND
jgi:uncharacterized membrane protein YkoI